MREYRRWLVVLFLLICNNGRSAFIDCWLVKVSRSYSREHLVRLDNRQVWLSEYPDAVWLLFKDYQLRLDIWKDEMNYIAKSTSQWCMEVITSSPVNRKIRPATLLVLISFIIIFLLTSCSNLKNPTTAAEGAQYLTPIPDETLAAFQEDTPIESKLQAVIAARAYLETTRLRSSTEPKVISVAEEHPNIWKIVFEGEWLINPPDPNHTFTPPPPEHGCVYVTIDATDQVRTEIGSIACSPWNSGGLQNS